MKILIIGPKSTENKLLVEAAKKHKHEVTLASIRQIVFGLKNNSFVVTYKGKDLAKHDVCLIRGVMPFFAQAKTVAKYLHRKGIQVIDKELYKKVYAFDKIFMYSALHHHGLPVMDTYFFPNMTEFRRSKVKFDFPVLVKDVQGMHGRNIFFKYNKKEFVEFFERRSFEDFFVQTAIEADHYYRVLVVGNKVLGSMQRYTLAYLKGKRIPLEKRSSKAKLTKEQKDLARKAARATNADIAGVDMIYDQSGNPYIMEVNRSPNFKRFTQVMNVDVADEIVSLLEKCVNKYC